MGDAPGAETAVGCAQLGSDDDVVLPDPIPLWLDQARKGKAGSKATIMTALPGNDQLRLQFMGKLGANEFLLRLAKDFGAEMPAEFSSELGLTTREGEVLSGSQRARPTATSRKSWA